MDKKIIGVMSLIAILSLSIFVSANMFVSEEYTSGNKYNVEIQLVEGWNILAGLYNINAISERSQIKKEDISVIWYYSPLKKEYFQMYPEEASEEDLNEDISFYEGDDPILTSAMWVYSKKAGSLSYSTIRYDKLNKRKLASGWNFVSITPDMKDGFVGLCKIEKSYFWDNYNKEWFDFPYSNPNEFSWDGDTVFGYGLIIKVSSDCTLGSSSVSSTNPPSLPSDEEGSCIDSDGGLNYYENGMITINGTQFRGDLCLNYYNTEYGTLREYYCDSDGNVQQELYECPNKCIDGACI